ncbi:hypothetical protein SAMN05216311_101438 [Chitinophaga sp. CF418]|nr:hypothetical protein SAMN05216311_101438 [Chitinophaga sp. CF418]
MELAGGKMEKFVLWREDLSSFADYIVKSNKKYYLHYTRP